MVNLTRSVRAAVQADYRQISELLRSQEYVHRHLDWRNPLDWIGTSPYLVLEADGKTVAAFACPPDPPHVAWVRLFVCSSSIPYREAWELTWQAAADQLTMQDGGMAAVIVLQEWMLELMQVSDFHYRQDIVMLERNSMEQLSIPLQKGCKLRPLMQYDLPAVAEVDAAAFEPLWQNSLPTLKYAFAQAAWAHVVETDRGIIGYQISTRNPIGGHLARLAVRPEFAGHGIGSTLVNELLQAMARQGLHHLTVNTQSDNAGSLALYHKVGFTETGDRFPVHVKQI